ncbi:plasmid replication protein RepC-8 (plasmid) [Sulfitobacter sp. DSM 110093]|uniref:plasmid replication protein RepC n=1 Tax=Sulfitobacter sp. DSM 110093 TaxID=2883127 RepID=UPI001FAD19F5|nr:plasmid replication protein RepC [Sulfitobacter sp. DSM 110093]UOA34146.1 plasmid replication protein RepC-8 [Sulfitobacter sp. DSM 110093]
MENTFRTAFGRPEKASQLSCEGPDKWALLDRLTIAADRFELSHRTLTVLKALLTFLPRRDIPDGAAGIVFASNARLSERLHGMPESTLRRHLAQLVRLGLIARHDSPNRKRFARNRGGAIALAFGFDLSPLVIQAEMIELAAREAEAEHERLLALRDRILLLRHALIRQGGAEEIAEEVGRVLRRKPDETALASVEGALQEALQNNADGEASIDYETASPAPATEQMIASDSQNERHIQDSIKPYFDSEELHPMQPSQTHTADNEKTEVAENKAITLAEVMAACTEVRSFFPEALRNWTDLMRIGDQVAPMLGIDPPVLNEAKRDMGAESAAVTVLCLLERVGTIRSPGAYLRRLTQMARDGAFSLAPMLSALKNRRDCQLTI